MSCENHSTNSNQEVDDVRDTRNPSRGLRRQSLTTRIVILCTVSTVLVPFLIMETPREISRWHQAAAMEDHLNGDYSAAILHLNDALRWDPGSVGLYLLRAEFKRDNDDLASSLDDCNKAVQLEPETVSPYLHRSQVLQDLGRHDEAVSDATKVVALSRNNRQILHPVALNNLAYFRAVAGVELQKALIDIEKALELRGADPTFLDTRGFIYYLLGKLEQAKADLDSAVRHTEEEYSLNYGDMSRARHILFDPRRFEIQKAMASRNLAILRYHRALILQGLDERELAEQDYNRVKQLGFEPNEKLY